jgi:hypothetical protein
MITRQTDRRQGLRVGSVEHLFARAVVAYVGRADVQEVRSVINPTSDAVDRALAGRCNRMIGLISIAAPDNLPGPLSYSGL